MMTDLDKAHAAIRAAAAELERDGIGAEFICDALMVTAINGAARLVTKDVVASWLLRAADMVREGQTIAGKIN